eukprot:243841-Chlamydomonas_euryale.AAC.2
MGQPRQGSVGEPLHERMVRIGDILDVATFWTAAFGHAGAGSEEVLAALSFHAVCCFLDLRILVQQCRAAAADKQAEVWQQVMAGSLPAGRHAPGDSGVLHGNPSDKPVQCIVRHSGFGRLRRIALAASGYAWTVAAGQQHGRPAGGAHVEGKGREREGKGKGRKGSIS